MAKMDTAGAAQAPLGCHREVCYFTPVSPLDRARSIQVRRNKDGDQCSVGCDGCRSAAVNAALEVAKMRASASVLKVEGDFH